MFGLSGKRDTTRRRNTEPGTESSVKPLQRSASTAADVPSPRLGGAAGEVVVLTGDGRDLDGFRPVLESAGYGVRVVGPELKAFHDVVARVPGLLIASIGGHPGLVLTFAMRLRESLGTFAPPLIVVAGGSAADEKALEVALRAGARDVLARPVHASLLRVKVAQFIRANAQRPPSLGGYCVRRTLGRGANGTVYLAERGGTLVALKAIDAQAVEADPESLARFRRETEALRRLRSPGVPRFYEAGRERDVFFCAMEYVPGDTLDALLDQGPLPQARVEDVTVEIARALLDVHASGLVHRDVKPANVIVTPEGRAKLVDFGLAKEPADASLTRCDEIVGSVAYMAPEVANGRRASPATDAYALGMTALTAALGECPLHGSSWEILDRVSRGEVPKPSLLLMDGPPRLKQTLDGLLRPNRTDRLLLEEVLALLA
jgi:predicted Ser/Thr protein kinase